MKRNYTTPEIDMFRMEEQDILTLSIAGTTPGIGDDDINIEF